MKPQLRALARRISLALEGYPRLHLWLKTTFLRLPARIRGHQMLWDALAAFGRRQEKGVFVLQIGANDGIHNDPVWFFIRKHGWDALLVEPVPRIFESLKENYRKHSGVRFANVAISDRDESRPFFFLDDPNGELPAWASEVGSFIPELVDKEIQGRDVSRFLREIEVPCLTPETLLRQYQVKQVDLVVIDAQGYDDRIVQCLPLERIRPKIIVYEHCMLSRERRAACDAFLEDHGYVLTSDRWDVLATLSDDTRAAPSA